MRLYVIVLFTLVILSGTTYADVLLQESPFNIEDYFNEGTHVNTRVINDHLELEYSGSYVSSGYWISPVFYISGDALWNHMEGNANWDEFGLNLIENGGFEEDPEELWSTWGEHEWDCSRSNSGSCSYLARVTEGSPQGLFRSNVVYDGWTVLEHHNTFPVTNNDIIHFTARIHIDVPQGLLKPSIETIRTPNGMNFYKTNYYKKIDKFHFGTKTNNFIKLQGRFDLTDVIPEDSYDYYSYPQIIFDNQGEYAPERKMWIDDILIFKDSRIIIQARTSSEPDCSGMQSWSTRPETLLYNNEISVPAPISKCIQFKINLERIRVDKSPELDSLEATYSGAFDFTRPVPDITNAIFTKQNPSVDEMGPISLGTDGELYFDQTGEKLRLFGFQGDHIQDEGEFSDPEEYANYVCSFAEKYGYNLIKWHNGGSTEETILTNLERHEPFVRVCREKGIYFFYRFTPLKYLDYHLNHNIKSGGFDGPVEFTNDTIIEYYKNYVDIVLNYEYESGMTIGEDPAFIFSELMNEVTLLTGWRHDKLDGIPNGEEDSLPNFRDISPHYSDNLRELFNQWVREKYPTYDELMITWGNAFIAEDGDCTRYPGPECNLVILLYSEYGYQESYKRRVNDLIEFLIQREEHFYTEMKNYIQSRSHMLVAGGKAFWGLDPTIEASNEVLDLIDKHPYGASGKSYWTAEGNYMTISNFPLIRSVNTNYLKKPDFAGSAFVAGETAYNPFSEHIAEYMMTPLLGANGGWDGIVLFMLQMDLESWWDDGKMGSFILAHASPVTAMQPVASRLFRRDMQPAPTKEVYMTRQSARNYDLYPPFYTGYKDPANQFEQNIVWGSMNHTEDILPNVPIHLSPPYQPDTNTFIYDIENRRVLITTDGTVGAFGDYDASSEDLDFMEFTINQKQGLPTYGIFLTSLDDLSLEESNDMLLTVIGNADNSNHIWDAYHVKSICDDCAPPMGSGPVMMSEIDATITLDIDANVTVYPLNKYGQKNILMAFPVEPNNGKVSFTVGSHRTPWYNVVVFDGGGAYEPEVNVTDCIDDDDICPENCTFINDNDCPVECIDDDDICPEGCNATNDNDCLLECIDDDD
ncbi:hypothetical protein ACFLQN_04890, partial [Candidatus Aenigmatarchaeota archaeon]